jgi:acyl-CoA hydrolase
MSRLSSRLFKALSDGRSLKWRPASREQVLARLLVKRAEAQQAGLSDLEASLRRQIAWSLPMRHVEEPQETDDEGSAHHRL